MRIGLYGGSFDPPHLAHLALARLARDHLGLDELRLVPAGRPWQKQHRSVTAGAHRAAMVALAIDGEPRLRLEVDELEHDGPSYTVETLQRLQAATPGDWFLVLGQDQYEKLPTWHRWAELVPRVTFAVAGRHGRMPEPPPELAALPHRSVVLPLPDMPLSSSDLRERLARGEDATALVPPAVARYIERNHLYRS